MALTKDCTYFDVHVEVMDNVSMRMSEDELYQTLWKVLKEDFQEKKKVEYTTPNGDKTFIRTYEAEPEAGVAPITFECNDEKYKVVFFFSHTKNVGIDNTKKGDNNVDVMADALAYSLNKALSAYNLSFKLRKITYYDNEQMSQIIYCSYLLSGKSIYL